MTTGNKLGAVVFGTVLLVVVGAFLAFGFVLLLGLAAAGLLLGTAAALYRRLTGRPQPPRHVGPRHGLDPSLEIAPPPDAAPPERKPERKSVAPPLDEG
ncbi:MAG: hypothetical protein ABIV11_01130 [Gemmatimonadaceae bacterium]